MLIGTWLRGKQRNGQFAFLPWGHPQRVANWQFIEIGVYALGGAHAYLFRSHAHRSRPVLHIPHLKSGMPVGPQRRVTADSQGT